MGPLGWAVAALSACLLLLVTVVAQTGLYETLAVLSPSMEPSVPQGSLVVVLAVDPEAIATGDIIAYASPQAPHPTVTHRVVSISSGTEGQTFTTKGDANSRPDPWEVRYAQRGGRVRLVIPWLGYILAGGTTGSVQLGLGALFGLLLAGCWLKRVWQPPPDAPSPQPSPARGEGVLS